MPHELDPILHPRSIAIVGASADPNKRGYRAVKALLAEGYLGTILPIHPKAPQILGVRCYPTVREVPIDIDLAVVCTPAATVCDILDECGAKGVKGALLVAGGFSESGEEGAALERQVVATARRHGIRLIGPNTNGLYSARQRCNTLGIADVPPGGLAMLSNSATVVLSLLAQAQKGFMGVHSMLSAGNQADIQFHEYLACLGQDADAKAIVSYVEGFADLPAFAAAAREVVPAKPVVMYVAGRTEEGRKAARSHSGSLAGDYLVAKGVLAQAGVSLVAREDELYPVAEALSLFPPMQGRRVGILSEGGGTITVAAEALAERQLALPPLSARTLEKIRALVPNASATANPVDFGSGTYPTAALCGAIARAMLEDPGIDALFIVGFFGGYGIRYPGSNAGEGEQAVCEELGRLSQALRKPVIVQSLYADFRPAPLVALRQGGVPFQRHIEIAAQCLAAAADLQAARARLPDRSSDMPVQHIDPRTDALLAACAEQRRNPLEPEARDILAWHGLALPAHFVVRSANDCDRAAAALGRISCAMKIVSNDLPHKSDVGGVMLNLEGAEALREAFAKLLANVGARAPHAAIDGVLVTPMARPGVEVIIGVTRSERSGALMMFGLGGIFVEVIRDVVFRALPLSRPDAEELIAQLRYPAMLEGVRGGRPANKAALVDLLLGVSAFMMLHPGIAELDLNPVIVDDAGCSIVDVRMVLGGPSSAARLHE